MNNSPLEFLANKLGNVVLYDSNGNPSLFVPFPKVTSQFLDASLPDHTHPAFRVNGVDLPRILIGKYKAAELTSGGTLYSLPNLPPKETLSADDFLTRMRAFGSGVSGKTVAESGLILLMAKKFGWTPKGNSNYGVSHQDGSPWTIGISATVAMVRVFRGWAYTCLVAHTTSVELRPDISPKYWQRGKQLGGNMNPAYMNLVANNYNGYTTLNGSGPLSWMLDGTISSVADVVGNSYELDYGYRLVNCEIQILENNNAADPTSNLSAASAAWKAILPNMSDDGYTLVAPGTAGTLHWTWDGTKITLDTVVPAFDSAYRDTLFASLGVNATNVPYVPHILKELGLFPITGDTTQGRVYIQMIADERFPQRGGAYDGTGNDGLGNLYARPPRYDARIGFSGRPVRVEL
jgi:sulfatase modifying factor 1